MEAYQKSRDGTPQSAANWAISEEKDRLETLFGHIFGAEEGYLVTFTGQQARLTDPDARQNELTSTQQKYWAYPDEADKAADYAMREAERQRDVYFGVHLFRESGNRLGTNAVAEVDCLWLDEDEGHYPDERPKPTAIVRSSSTRRHLYWRLTHPVSVEWAVTMNRRIAAWADGDSGKAGLATVLRVPGTSNFKRYPQIDPVTAEIYEGGAWEPELMEQAIPLLPDVPMSNKGRKEPYDGPSVDIADYLPNVEVIRELSDGLGIKYQIVCPWVDEHSGGDRTGTRIGQRAEGGLWFYCDHAHCAKRGWSEFRSKVFPVREITISRRHTNPSKKVTFGRG
jgi:hypothetical protein